MKLIAAAAIALSLFASVYAQTNQARPTSNPASTLTAMAKEIFEKK